jgi:hypothetical protein
MAKKMRAKRREPLATTLTAGELLGALSSWLTTRDPASAAALADALSEAGEDEAAVALRRVPMEKPLEGEALLAAADNVGTVSGVVAVTLDDLVNGSFEGFIDFLSLALVGTDTLSSVSYDVVGFGENNVLHLLVSGDASYAINDYVYVQETLAEENLAEEAAGDENADLG